VSTKFFFSITLWLVSTCLLPAQSELESLRTLVREQERQIRQLEEENVRLRLALEQRRTEESARRQVPAAPAAPAKDDASRGLVPAVPAGSASPRPAPATTPQGGTASGPVYVVQAGDNLTKIARQAGCTVAELLRENDLKIDAVIRPGQALRLPSRQNPPPTPAPNAPATEAPTSQGPAAPAASAAHTVQAGETIHAIARQRGVSAAALLAANPEIRPTAMRPGQVLRLPHAEAAESPTPPSRQEPVLISASAGAAQAAPMTASPRTRGSASRMVLTDGSMTYAQFAAKHQTSVDKLNELNALAIPPHAILAKGAELRVPTW
jgi:LysM repeat protein